jgi:hypothetical protein
LRPAGRRTDRREHDRAARLLLVVEATRLQPPPRDDPRIAVAEINRDAQGDGTSNGTLVAAKKGGADSLGPRPAARPAGVGFPLT